MASVNQVVSVHSITSYCKHKVANYSKSTVAYYFGKLFGEQVIFDCNRYFNTKTNECKS